MRLLDRLEKLWKLWKGDKFVGDDLLARKYFFLLNETKTQMTNAVHAILVLIQAFISVRNKQRPGFYNNTAIRHVLRKQGCEKHTIRCKNPYTMGISSFPQGFSIFICVFAPFQLFVWKPCNYDPLITRLWEIWLPCLKCPLWLFSCQEGIQPDNLPWLL